MSFFACASRRKWPQAAGGNPLSNISMDGWRGGKLFVPPNEYDEFLCEFGKALQTGETMYLIERRTDPIFKWHADLV